MALSKVLQARVDDINEAIDKAIIDFHGALPLAQKRLIAELKRALKDLKLTSLGMVSNTAQNIMLVRKITDQLKGGLVTKEYIKALDNYLAAFNPVRQLNNKYFDVLNVNFVPNKARYTLISEQIIESTKETLDRGGVWGVVMKDINDLLRVNVGSGASYDEFIQTLTTQIGGTPQTLGYVEKYAKQIVTDSIMQYNRQMQSTISTDLGLEWYYYQGSLIKDSRPFCKERAGKYYHQKEVESWANKSWQGKFSGTDETTIFTYAGGYNCRHSIIPVSRAIVPKSDIERARAMGFIK